MQFHEGHRGAQAIGGITMAQLYAIVLETVENMTMGEQSIDPTAVTQNVCVKLEKHMGIYPNTEPQYQPAGPASKLYTASSLDDIAQLFLHSATREHANGARAMTQKAAAVYAGRGNVWTEAAAILRDTELRPPPSEGRMTTAGAIFDKLEAHRRAPLKLREDFEQFAGETDAETRARFDASAEAIKPLAEELKAAASPSGPFPGECSATLKALGRPYPRTCAVHGLGPCLPPAQAKGDPTIPSAPDPAAQEARPRPRTPDMVQYLADIDSRDP